MAALGLLYFLATSSPLSYSLYFLSLHNCHACACSNFFHALEPTNPWRQVMIYAVICLEANFLTWSGNASLPFSCVLQFTSDSASLVLSFALDVPLRTPPFPSTSTYALSSRCRRNRHRLAENPQLALHKVCISLFSITYDGSMVAQKCSCLLIWSFKFCPFFSPVFRILYAPLTTPFLNRHFFSLHSSSCSLSTGLASTQPERMHCPYFRSYIARFA